jgi:hypothetical protein
MSYEETAYNTEYYLLVSHQKDVQAFLKEPTYDIDDKLIKLFYETYVLNEPIIYSNDISMGYVSLLSRFTGDMAASKDIYFVGPPRGFIRKAQSDNYSLLDLEMCLDYAKSRLKQNVSLENILLESNPNFQFHYQHVTTAALIKSVAEHYKNIVFITHKPDAQLLPLMYGDNLVMNYEQLVKAPGMLVSRNRDETIIIKQALLDALYGTKMWDDFDGARFFVSPKAYFANKQEYDRVFREAYTKYRKMMESE